MYQALELARQAEVPVGALRAAVASVCLLPYTLLTFQPDTRPDMPKRTPLSILIPALTAPLLWSCDADKPVPDVDPQVGRECFELHRAKLPPGTQYEGIDAAGEPVTIKVMTGAELTRVRCTLGPHGKLHTKLDERD